VAEEARAGGHLDDATLLNEVRAGDPSAFGVLHERHEAAARRLAASLVGRSDLDATVAEAFARVLEATRRGGGPADAFRPYLLTALRRVCHERASGQPEQVPTDAQQLPDPGQPFIDPAVAGLEGSLIVRAFLSLPERWRGVLWHTEVEEADPAEAARIFGLTRSGVSTLRRRASEGLRQARIQMYLSSIPQEECRAIADRLGPFLGRALSREDTSMVAGHLGRCGDCRSVCAEVADLTAALREQVAPMVLGSTAPAYLSGARGGGLSGARGGGLSRARGGGLSGARGGGAAAAGARAGSRDSGATAGTARRTEAPAGAAKAPIGSRAVHRLRRMPRQQRWLAAGAAVVAAAMAIGGWTVSMTGYSPSRAPHSPRAVAVAASPSASPEARPAASPAAPSQRRRHRHHRDQPPYAGPTAPATTPTAVRPSASPSPTPSPSAKLAVMISLSGARPPWNMALAEFRVADTAGSGTGELSASISLPSGAWLISDGQNGWQGWACHPDGRGAMCEHGPLPVGGQARGLVVIAVGGGAACGRSVRIAVRSGAGSASARSADIPCGTGWSWPSWQPWQQTGGSPRQYGPVHGW
jgi:DNA-directed RNA polymerase specialized sigma24 family protein